MKTNTRRRIISLGGSVLLGAALILGIPAPTQAKTRNRPNVIVITLDTTRPDHLGFYGYSRPTSPTLDRLAKTSTVFTHAYSTTSWTLPAHASLFTGRFVTSHGTHYDPNGPLMLTSALSGPKEWNNIRAQGLDPGLQTLAETLRKSGYITAAVVAGPWLKRVFGLDAGFDSYDDHNIEELSGRLGEDVTDAALKWLEIPREKPFFLFLNYFDAHGPYQPPIDLGRIFLDMVPKGTAGGNLETQQKIALYDAEIRTADRAIGRLFDTLNKRDEMENSWIVITADHGELFGEHGLTGHGMSLSEEETRIPLLVRPPRGSQWTAPPSQPVQLVDLMPTLLANLHIPLPDNIQGQPIGQVTHPIISEFYPLAVLKRGGSWKAIVDGNWKFVEHTGEPFQLFDLTSSDGESKNRFKDNLERGYEMFGRLDEYLRNLPKPTRTIAKPAVEVDASTQRALKSLGYIDSDSHDDTDKHP